VTGSFICRFFLLALFFFGVVFSPLSAVASELSTVKIGVLAKRGEGHAVQIWTPTAEYLSSAIPTHSFEIVPLNFTQVHQAVQDRTIDFIIANSAYYVDLEYKFGVSRIATMKNLFNHVPKSQFGGVIFTRSDNKDINGLHDLNGKSFSAVDQESFGGWLMALREFQAQGINPRRDFKTLKFVGTHDAVVLAVLSGEADAGTVRTDTLEKMAEEGSINLASIKILNPQHTDNFEYLHSTRLYPEWPFAKLQHTAEKLSEDVAVALLRMPPQSQAAQIPHIGGWTVPLSYQPVHQLFQELALGPYAHHFGKIHLVDFVIQYWIWLLIISVLLALLLFFTSHTVQLNRKLVFAQAELGKQLDTIKSAQKAVQESERNYREIFHSANDAFFVHDLVSGAILDVNKAMCEMYGYSRDEVLSLSMDHFSAGTPPFTSQDIAQWIARTLAEGPQTFEWLAKRKNNDLFWVEVNLKQANIGGQNRLLSVVHNIEDRKKAEAELNQYSLHLEQFVEERTAELRKSESSLAKAQRIAHLGNWDWLIPENLMWWSAEATRIYGFEPEKNSPFFESFISVIHPADRDLVNRAISDALEKQSVYNMEHRLLLPDGTVRHVHTQGEVVYAANDKPSRMVGIVQDITGRVELEKQLRQAQKMEAIGTLAGGIAHDFNNMLVPILGYSELLLTKLSPDDPLTRDVLQITKAAGRAKDLIQQILAFSRQDPRERKPFQPHLVVKEALKLIRASLPSTIEIRKMISPECGAILADPTQLHQVIMNLCTNAYHAMRESGGILGVSLTKVTIEDDSKGPRVELAPGDYVLIEVSDTGSGMEQKTLAHIFEPYFTTKRKGEGTGLGLSMVHGIVKSYQGHITVYSEPGKGTRFHVYLPRIAEAPSLAEAVATKPIPTGHERLLVVDDETEITSLLESILTNLGYQVTVINDSEEALARITHTPGAFDLLITDITMPHLNGIELTTKVQAIRPDIPVILCTGYSELIKKEQAHALGIRAYLTKPISLRELAMAVRKALDEK